eukprot:CAMPEP_0179129278 /NCGR_PEP_ID=MMETSP0796-20121207/61331_1 /TAXON_ID=73915 /ORGANISM="Pyrodinium bahamense, Strain pbaha01" /LENGTH=308 /DNA_ID=CAMNT_0020828151 /DNA_START=38 /DNA_END=961 /DNA_ORIENTATION=-
MAVFSKMSSTSTGRRGTALVAGASVCAMALSPSMKVGFIAPTRPGGRQDALMSTALLGETAPRGPMAEELREDGAQRIVGYSAVAAAALVAAPAMKSRRMSGQRGRALQALRQPEGDADPKALHPIGLHGLVALAEEMISRPDRVDAAFLRRIRDFAARELSSGRKHHAAATRAFAQVLEGAEAFLRVEACGQMRWAASSIASMLITSAVTLQPASALEQVTYSDFLEQVQKGEVEMVRVQSDLLTAQYTAKDGARREVNLVPNASVEDALFNTLAEKKVDVVMQSANANSGGPLEFLARFAGPIAWL